MSAVRRRGRKEEKSEPIRFGATLPSTVLPGATRHKKGRDPYEEEDDFVTPMERAAFREQKTASWARTMPLRLQQFLQHSGNDITMRIFRDVIVRFPVLHGTKAEILAFLQPYGQVEYVSGPDNTARATTARKDSPAGEGEGGSGEGSGSVELGIDSAGSYCHLVRFEEGADAIRCFFSLNGAMIDPEQHKLFVEGVKEAYALATAEQSEDGQPLELPDTFQFPLMAAADHTRHIFITVDFFRMAFVLPPAGDGPGAANQPKGRSPTARSPASFNNRGPPCIAARSTLCTLVPSHRSAGPSISQLHQQLRAEALKMADLYPLVQSHRGVEWEEFCFLINFFSFLHNQYIPTYPGEESPAFATEKEAEREVDPTPLASSKGPEDSVPALSIAGAARTVFNALKHTSWDAIKVLNWIDLAQDQGERVLLEGRLITATAGPKKRWLAHSHVKHFLIFALMLCLLCLVLYLV